MVALSRSAGRAPDTTAATLQAPTGGLNDRDSIANMPVTDAVILTNWWPEPSHLSIREGSQNHVTGFTEPVETLVEYSPQDGATELWAASGGNLYDVTTPGALGAPIVTGQLNNRWQSVAAATAGGSFLYLFNGEDAPLLYDGTTWKPIDGGSTPAITGVDTTKLISGCVFKNRLYMVEKNSLSLWYLPFTSIGGAAKELPLGTIFQRGGSIQAIFTWTIDAGNGADDHFVIISSNGEVAVYGGTDPETVGAFSLIGIFQFGRPVGNRCGIKFGGDLLILCEDGVFPLAQGLLTASIDRRVAITDKIQNGIRKEIKRYRGNFGWELCLSPENSAVIVNIPAQNGQCYQFAQNTLTGAWTKFEGWNAKTWINSSLGLFFGAQNSVRKGWVGRVDIDQPIVADALQAFSYFGSMSRTKFFTMIRPYIQTSGSPSILYSLNGDFNPQLPTGTLTYTPPTGMIWGHMRWGTMQWGGSLQLLNDWATVGGIYKSAAVRMKVQGNGSQVDWAATDVMYSRGGLL